MVVFVSVFNHSFFFTAFSFISLIVSCMPFNLPLIVSILSSHNGINVFADAASVSVKDAPNN